MGCRRAGFSLVEVIITVLILSILAMVVIPRVNNASTDARDAALVSDLRLLRQQIEVYKCEHRGRSPHVKPNGTPDNVNLIGRLMGRTDEDGTLNPAGKCGPYVPVWPTNQFAIPAKAGDIRFGAATVPPRNDQSGWYFCTTNATMHVNTVVGAETLDP